MKLPILGNLGLKELLILGGSALVAYYFINKHATEFRAYEKEILAGDKKIPAIAPIANTPTNPVPPFREMERISAFNARESSSGCGCGA